MSQTPAEPADDDTYTAGLDTGQGDGVIDLDETLGSDDVDATLDTSWSPPEKPRGMDQFGTTRAEELEGESLDQRLAQEEPDPAMAFDDPLAKTPDDERGDAGDEYVTDEVGDRRAGRLVDPDQGGASDAEKDLVGSDVGIDGGAASAEEAAMHVVDEAQGDMFTEDELESFSRDESPR